jgi:nicotinate dehydrogenase subunit B
MNAATKLAQNRRSFLKASALTVAFSWSAFAPVGAQAPAAVRLPGSLNTNRMLDGWLRINPNGTVTIFTGKVELGQGILTALSQMAADELDVDLKRLEIVSGDTERTPNEGFTAGSLSIQDSGTALRYACAEARGLLLQAAALKLGVPANALSVRDGTISKIAGGTVTGASYWDLTSEAVLKREASGKTAPKPASQHRLIGQSQQRRDIPAKVTGGEAYVHDMRLPKMVYGRVVRPNSPSGRLVSADEAKARGMPGVVAVVRDGNFLAVAAKREEQAIAASRALMASAKWEEPASLPPSGAALFDYMKQQRVETTVVSDKKDATAAATAVRSLESEFTKPYLAHASIGPSCAVAQWDDGKLRVWCHSQGVFPLRGDLAKSLRTSESSITVSHHEGSGCYGQNGADDVAMDAALLARALPGVPVKLQWMREDEFGWEPLGSPMVMKLKASLDASGRVVDWAHELWSYTHNTRPLDPDGVNLLAAWTLKNPLPRAPARNIPQPAGGSDRNAVPLYVFPQQKITNRLLLDAPIRTSALRTLGAYANVFALESFMDELAVAAGAPPIEFRLRHLTDPRAKAVIERAASMAEWPTSAPAASSRESGGFKGRGFAFAKYKNLAVYCAVVADVAVNPQTGAVRVERIWSAVDAGLVINPDGLRNQIEGGIVQSTSWTLHEGMKNDATHKLTRNWPDYPILRFTELPAVKVELINRPEEPSHGVGEGAHGPTVAAIANAFAHATGKRLRDLPFNPDRVKQVLA